MNEVKSVGNQNNVENDVFVKIVIVSNSLFQILEQSRKGKKSHSKNFGTMSKMMSFAHSPKKVGFLDVCGQIGPCQW